MATDKVVQQSDNVYTYSGAGIDVKWDGRLCIHISECTRAHGELFVSGRQPWGQPDLASSDEVVAVVKRCPTGALTFVRKDGGEGEQAATRNVVLVANNGPLYAQGDLVIDGASTDMPGVRFRAALCRCGQSQNKPFCDNSHEAADFRDRGAVGETGELDEVASSAAADGPLEIRRAKNGPLLISGHFTIVTGSGRQAWRGTKAAICRCGASQNKPFCDGSHGAAGFAAD